MGRKYRRKLIQLFSALIYNCNIKGFTTGSIYKGNVKTVCVPGLNCYSCPGAVASCPLGSLQNTISSSVKHIYLYVIGILMLFGVLFGRMICAFACPFGLIQELLYKIPGYKIKKSKVTRALSLVKYFVLGILVLAIPFIYALKTGISYPAFCKFVCPAGTLEAGIPLTLMNSQLSEQLGGMFTFKLILFIIVILAAIFMYRPFCRFLCPLGAIYSLFNKYAVFGIRIDESKCTHCDACVRACKLDVKHVNDRECIRCGECREYCKTGALERITRKKKQTQTQY